MPLPTLEQYRTLAATHNRVTVYREIVGDLVTPICLLRNFSAEKYLFLLESANLDKSFSRYTFFGYNPARVITFRDATLTVASRDGRAERIDMNPLAYLMQQLESERSYKDPEKGAFCGGYVGFMGYDMVNYMGTLRKPVTEERGGLLMAYLQVDEFFVFDNAMGKLYAACSTVPGTDPESAYLAGCDRTLQMATEILNVNRRFMAQEERFVQKADFDREAYIESVGLLQEEIRSGECIQAVLSNRYEIECTIDPVNLYRALRNINPSPYMFYFKLGDEVLCGTSPEVHLTITDGMATLKPIAGTYRIGGDEPGSVEELTARLLADEKERAEHLMLLDLARNDLYTGCETGSVRVMESFSPEVYSHLIHIVSRVQGRLRDDVPPLRLFCNTFPAGTLSGAPKVRAIELIDQYEKTPRGFYGGCAGYFSYSQDIDTCIIIRSAMARKDAVVLRAGAGIVYDSVPEREFNEVGAKLGALIDSLKKLNTLEKKNVFADR